MKSFVNRYLARVAKQESILCVGLDPTPAHVPPQYGTGLSAMEYYLKDVVEAAATRVPVVKPQYAYYAAMGTDYIKMMIRLIEYAHEKGLLVILDAKRADIGETMEQYGNEVFGQYGVDACTFVPYLGATFMPSWLSWLEQGKMVISMIRTSNPDGDLIQGLKLENGKLVYEQLAEYVSSWNREVRERTSGIGSVGGVVGATFPAEAMRCRAITGADTFFLIPGYGAQGGGAAGAVTSIPTTGDRLMGTVNSSRGLTRDSWKDKNTGEPKIGDPLELVINAIDFANSDLNGALSTSTFLGGRELSSWVKWPKG